MRRGPASIAVLTLLVGAAAGVGTAALLGAPAAPDSLAPAASLAQAPVTVRDFTDRRSVALRVSARHVPSVTARVAGFVTASACVPGEVIASGGSTFALDGSPLVNLHTDVPLWRTLSVGDRGDDVAALHAELRRLGVDAPQDDRVTAATLRSYRTMAASAGLVLPSSENVVDPARVVWLPTAEVTAAQCPTPKGMDISAGDPLVDLPSAVAAATVVDLPSDRAAGDRVVTVDGAAVPLAEDGRITDPAALAAIAGSQAYADASATADDAAADVTLTVSWQLVEPLSVWVVPPAAVIGAGTDRACVEDDGATPLAVEIVGSELGQTFVIPAVVATPVPAHVRIGHDGGAHCG